MLEIPVCSDVAGIKVRECWAGEVSRKVESLVLGDGRREEPGKTDVHYHYISLEPLF